MRHDPTFGATIANVSRRAFLTGIAAGSLILSVGLPVRAEEQKYAGDGMPNGLREDPKIFIAIAEDGTVTVLCHRSEMGQGVRTSWPLVVADELDADWSRVKVAQAPGDEARFGNQDTDGSRSMRHHFMTLRRMGAAARQMLEQAAANQWGVPVAEVKATNHEVVHKASNRRLGYGELAKAAADLPVPPRESLALKHPSEFRYIGKSETPLIDGFDITTGKAQYGIDTQLDGMVYAVVARPPVFGGTVKSYDDAETLKVPGVLKTVAIEPTPAPAVFQPLGGVAVVATNTWAAIKGREALKIEWDDGPNASYSSEEHKASLETAVRNPGTVVREDGDTDKALGSAAKRVEAEYYIPHLAHATMEPPAAVVRIAGGKCEAWACVQSPQATRDHLSQRLGIPVENVTVNVTLLGGGFGRKSKPDYVVEAALISKGMDGKPVKVTWTREDDITNDYFHAVSMERIEAGLDESGKPVAWLHRSAAPTILSIFAPDPKQEADFELAMGLIDMPFDIPNVRVENPQAAAHTRIGWFRSVYNIPHAFAVQSFAAELAAAAGRDQKDYLLELIGPPRQVDTRKLAVTWNYGEDPAVYLLETKRLRGVVETAAEAIQWGRSMPKGSGLGIAAHRSFVTYVAAAVEVEVSENGALTIPRVDIAVDCGPQINPDRIRSQMEGAVVMGVSLATLGEITFKNGRTEQANFDTFEVTRIDAAPKEIHVHLMPASDYNLPLGGVGEPGVPPIAPALTNAIFAATGKRIRRLPIRDQLAT
ncbi:xanthine dehydrogenase family protein molybdopterin-binding subunit [Dongia deserti]|uniref:xanthine dehydrogenase family protein molybdopterin-binding subunit n=1 Tax=Dongia deserti TaxID=2268030 RepID=UPI000E64ADB4|nr:xanthine dehydrogenase family protein molybdopterin-binding subunit [Dongia deserti]